MFDTLFVTENAAAAPRARSLPFATLVHVGALGVALAASHVVMEVVQDPDFAPPIMWTTFAPPPALGGGGGARPPARPIAPPVKRTTPAEPVQPTAPPVALNEAPQPQAAAPSEPGPEDDGPGGGGSGDGPAGPGRPDGVPDGQGDAPWGNSLFGNPERPSEPILVTGRVVAPELLEKVSPEYPETARRVRLEGRVVLRATIGLDGRVEDVTVLSGNPLLTASAVDAVRRWRYRPASLNGQPVRVYFSAVVWFRLE